MRKKSVAKPESSSRKSTLSTRDRIIASAVKLYGSKSVSEITLADIARDSKMTHQLVSYHFRTEEELQIEAVRFASQNLKTWTDDLLAEVKPGDPVKLIEAYVRAPFTWAAKNPGLFRLRIYFYYMCTYSESMSELIGSTRKTGRQRIENLIYRGIETGAFRKPPELAVEELAETIQDLISGAVVCTLTEKDGNPKKAAATAVASILSLLGAG